MSLKTNVLVFMVGVVVGSVIKDFTKKPEPQPPTQTKAKSGASVQKITKLNGEVIETVNCESSSELSPASPVVIKKKYSVAVSGLKNIDSVAADLRLGNTPLFFGVVINKELDKSKLQLRMEF